MTHHQSHSTFTRVFVVLAVLGLLISGGYAIRHTVSCFLSSFIIAYLLDPALVFLEQRTIKRIYGILILYLVLALVTFFCVIYLLPLITMRWDSFVRHLPDYFQKAREIVVSMKTSIYSAERAQDWSWIIDSLASKLETITSSAGTGVFNTASSMAFNLFNLILSPILVFFMLLYKEVIIASIKVWLPARQKEHLLEVGREVNASIGGYIRGQLIVSVIVAVFSAIALYLLDVDYALLNGLFAGLASTLPFIGVILATIPPLFFAYVKFQNGLILLKVIGAFSLIYFLEGYLVKPLVFKEAMNLNPLMTIVVVMALGELMGFWGIILAIPIAAALKILSTHWRRGDFTSEV